MGKAYKLFICAVVVAAVSLIGLLVMNLGGADVLNPAGPIAGKEKNLMVFAIALMMVIVVPVFAMTFFISWKYREGNKKKTKYQPNWDRSPLFETIWWGFPLLIIGILSVVTWQSSHELDPFKPIASEAEPLTVQVVALQWKWLFIYPEQKIASVNFVQFPKSTPVTFQLTSSGAMNSFWIPRLGGQMYAMSGMSTDLNLMAEKTGSFKGSSANISGEGFAGMKFTARSSTRAEFDQWLTTAHKRSQKLTMDQYNELEKPTKNNQVSFYADVEPDLYTKIVNKYMAEDNHTHPADHTYTGAH
jgi:cytochrome o ubiquinol oxidase subunit 2